MVTPIANEWYWDSLACPDCNGKLVVVDEGVQCSVCRYDSAGRDFRPKKPVRWARSLRRLQSDLPTDLLRSIATSRPAITYAGPPAVRDSRELMSIVSANTRSSGRVLDLGCGPGDQRIPIEYLGYQYVGVDYSAAGANLLVDAHALPFAPSSFDCVFSYAVLEHLHSPVIAISEIERVLAGGGIYVGTVSLGEPFHDSYFHHTVWGLISLLGSTEAMRLVRVWAASDTLYALSTMGRYPRVLRAFLSLLNWTNRTFPILAPRKMNWPTKDREIDAIHRAGSIAFLVQKA